MIGLSVLLLGAFFLLERRARKAEQDQDGGGDTTKDT